MVLFTFTNPQNSVMELEKTSYQVLVHELYFPFLKAFGIGLPQTCIDLVLSNVPFYILAMCWKWGFSWFL